MFRFGGTKQERYLMEMQSKTEQTRKPNLYILEDELCKHAWFPKMTAHDAEAVLKNMPTYTYLLRKSQSNLRKYDISYVDQKGTICHDTFTLINPKLGIFLNGQNSHLGKLEKVIRDMMHCEQHQGQPLKV